MIESLKNCGLLFNFYFLKSTFLWTFITKLSTIFTYYPQFSG